MLQSMGSRVRTELNTAFRVAVTKNGHKEVALLLLHTPLLNFFFKN